MISSQVGDVKIHIGDTLKVHTRIVESGKERVQIFEGILISLRGRGENASFIVRKIGAGAIGVERTWPINNRSIIKIEVKKKATKVRRAKLYYLRDRIGKEATRV